MHQCGSHFMNAQVELCPPLKRLQQEHGPLRAQMDAFRLAAGKIGAEEGPRDWRDELAKLQKQVSAFVSELESHSDKEEGVLFPIMAKYIGRETGPIAVMEFEHEEAKRNLRLFAEAVSGLHGPVDGARARTVAGYAIEAQAILADHFMKEENVLFPMAERLLSGEEKRGLERSMYGGGGCSK